MVPYFCNNMSSFKLKVVILSVVCFLSHPECEGKAFQRRAEKSNDLGNVAASDSFGNYENPSMDDRKKLLPEFSAPKPEYQPGVYISVSPAVYKKVEINWYDLGNGTGSDRVALYDRPRIDNKTKPLLELTPTTPDGYYLTNFSRSELKQTIDEAQYCQGHWIYLIRNDKVVASNCFKMNPTWMKDKKDCLVNKSLAHSVIPSTHDSAAVDLDFGQSVISRYTRTQEIRIWEQLLYGVRHLDLRAAVGAIDNDFYIVHGEFYLPYKLRDIFTQVKKFLQMSDEIVIMEVSGFSHGFSGDLATPNHKRLIKLIHDEFGEFMVPRSYGFMVKYDRLWKENKRLIVTYRNSLYSDYPLLWHYIVSTYSGTTSLQTLKSKTFTNLKKLDKNIFRILSGELTPQVKDVIEGFFDSKLGLRTFANMTDRLVTSWIRHELREYVNIVMVDFLLGSDNINVAIDENCRRS